jgi:hypothetical protein
MQVTITGCDEQQPCVWCDHTKEVIEVTFDDGFLEKGHLCWRCLQRAVRVRSRKEDNGTPKTKDVAG